MADYLQVRPVLRAVVLMIDSRLGFTPLDRQLLDFVGARVASGEVRLLALLTKADKLNRQQAQAALAAAQEVLGPIAHEPADVSVSLFSALSGAGVEDVAQTLREWVPQGADATAAAGVPEAPAPAATGAVAPI
jgi:GTP-binding protein